MSYRQHSQLECFFCQSTYRCFQFLKEDEMRAFTATIGWLFVPQLFADPNADANRNIDACPRCVKFYDLHPSKLTHEGDPNQ